jgi:hypothetical protein
MTMATRIVRHIIRPLETAGAQRIVAYPLNKVDIHSQTR